MKKIFSSLFTLIFLICNLQFGICNLCAQPVTQEWVRNYPGPSNDLYGPFLAVDKQGNSYIAGTHVVNDTPKVLCVKYNTQGVQQWDALYIYPGEAYIRPTGLALDSSGNAYVISEQGPSYLLPTNGLIAKFNSLNGNLVWAKRYIGQYGWGPFRDIKIDRLNNVYVVGWSDTSHLVIRYNTNGDSIWVRKYHPSPYPPFAYIREVTRACTIDDSLNIVFTGIRMAHYAPYNVDYDSLLVVKYSSSGVLRWESVYAYNWLGSDVGTKITADQNGNMYIGGVTTVSGDAVYLTLKYDRNGVQQWARIYNPSGSTDNTIYGIAMDRIYNTLFVTGYSVINSIGSAATIKYNALTGDSIWVRRGFSVPGSSSAWDIETDSSGNAYITGSSRGVSSSDVSTLKYSPMGDTQWLMTYNGPFNGGDGGRALEINLNSIYVLGYSQSSSQISDYVLIKYSQFVGIQVSNNGIPKIYEIQQNYPNPFNTSTKINLLIPKKSFIQLKIYDVLGRVNETLIEKELGAADYEIVFNGANYSSGVYFYQMLADGIIIGTKKLVLIK